MCATETRPAHPRSCSFRIRRAITAAFASPLLLPARLAKSVAASLSVASAAPRRALDVVEPWKETLDAMLFAGKLLPNPLLLFLCSLACASAVRTSVPCYSSFSCCRIRAYSGLATSLPRTPEPHAFLARVTSCYGRPRQIITRYFTRGALLSSC
jgi:hypothetical protein